MWQRNVLVMDSTDLKISKLKQTFPEIEDASILLEILISCNGSLKQAEAILLEQFDQNDAKKRKLEEISTSKYQSSIKSFFNGSKRLKGHARTINKSNTKTITLHTKEDVEETLPYITFHKNFLPPDVANNILTYLMENKGILYAKTFHLFDNDCVSNHKSGVFSSNETFINDEADLSYNAIKVTNIGRYNDALRILQMLVEDKVESLIHERTKLADFQTMTWKGDFSICNLFETKENNLDWHSDRLSDIGPLPTIASLSLGATREFKVRKNHPVKLNHNPIYSIPLPHNTLIIMHSGCQEEYKHTVMLTPNPIEGHPISNQMRFNLTLRNYLPKFYETSPHCKCGLGMILRRSYKEVASRGKYFWQCENIYQNKSCGLFHWAQFKNENSIADDEKNCSVWVADDDFEKFEYLKENSIIYDGEKGIFIYE